MRREVAFGEERSRVDWVLEAPGREACYVTPREVRLAERIPVVCP